MNVTKLEEITLLCKLEIENYYLRGIFAITLSTKCELPQCKAEQCKLAWEDCCLPKGKGGLGILDIAKKNISLLKKFLFKFHCVLSAPWIDWLRIQHGWSNDRDFGDDMPNITPIWRDIYAQLPSFWGETMVLVGNGQMTSFWLDLSCGSHSLTDTFSGLVSHDTRPNASVARVLSTPEILLSLCPRLSNVSSRELLELQA